ncbi:MAG: hypothetical protein ABL921_08050 [Pirellula sp.]
MNDSTLIAVVSHMLRPKTEETEQALERTRRALLAELESPASEMSIENTDQQFAGRQRSIAFSKVRKWAQVAIAGSIILMVFTAWIMVSPRSVMAHAISQMLRANTFRCTVESRGKDGSWVRSDEMLFSQSLGILHRSFVDSRVVRIEKDDRQQHWLYRDSQPIAVRSKSTGFDAALERLLGPLADSKSGFTKITEKSLVESNERLQCYVMSDKQSRTSIWVDRLGRLRRFTLESLQEDQWTEWQRCEVFYDVVIDTSLFSHSFGEGVREVAPQDLLNERFALDKAIHREVQFGFEIAVHDLKRLGENRYYMLLSFRPTEATQRKAKLRPGEKMSEWHVGLRQDAPGIVESALSLAEIQSGDLTILPVIGKLGSFNNDRIDRARPVFTLFIHHSLWKEMKAISHLPIEVPLPEDTTNSEDSIRSAYELCAFLESIPMDTLNLTDPWDTREFVGRENMGVGQSMSRHRVGRPRPSEIDFKLFLEHIQRSERGEMPPNEPARTSKISNGLDESRKRETR